MTCDIIECIRGLSLKYSLILCAQHVMFNVNDGLILLQITMNVLLILMVAIRYVKTQWEVIIVIVILAMILQAIKEHVKVLQQCYPLVLI